MTSTCRLLTVAALAVAAATAPLSGAAAAPRPDDSGHSINIAAHIPTREFHAQPLDPDFGRNEVMTDNPVSGTLSSLGSTFDVRNTNGSIDAYIEGGPATLSNGSDTIPLTVSLNGVTLTETPQEVVSDAESTPGTQADLVVTADRPAGPPGGLYTGSLAVVFDAVPCG